MEDFKFEKAREAIEDLSDEQRDALLFMLLTNGQIQPGDELQIELIYENEEGLPLETSVPDALPVDFGEEYFGENAQLWAKTLYQKLAKLDVADNDEISSFRELLKGALGLFGSDNYESGLALRFFDSVRKVWHDSVSSDSKEIVLSQPSGQELDSDSEDLC